MNDRNDPLSRSIAGRFDRSVRRQIDERARQRIAEVEHRLELLAAALGVDLDRLELLERVERRGGDVLTWEEAVAVGLEDGGT